VFICIKLFVLLIFVFIFNFLYHAIERITVRSIAYTGLSSNSLTCVRVQRPTSHTHLLCAHAHHTLCTVLLEYDRAHLGAIEGTRLEPSRDLFLSHFLSFSLSLSLCAVHSPHPIFVLTSPKPSLTPPYTATHPLPSHRATSAPPPHHHTATTGPSFIPFFPIFFSLTNPTSHHFFFFVPILCYLHAQTVGMDCACPFCVGIFCFCKGLG
jgi:hypothetical protein